MKFLIATALLVSYVCLASPNMQYLPDAKLTPGATLNVDLKTLCTPGYTKTVRNVPYSLSKAVYARYGIKSHTKGQYEVDHLVSLELGGSNDITNLWCEPYDLNVDGYQMGAHVKDETENATHAAVCSGKISLKDAQTQIAKDWTVLYKKFVSPTFPKYVPIRMKGI